MKPQRVDIDGRELSLTHLDKIFYPETGFTKGQVIDYYARIAPVLLPHLKDRPVTLKRYPDGVKGEYFYEKRAPKYRPAWLKTAAVASKRDPSGKINYCLINDLPSLIWAANLGNLELHTFLARQQNKGIAWKDKTNLPDQIDRFEGSPASYSAEYPDFLRSFEAFRQGGRGSDAAGISGPRRS
jgi:DNA primase